MKARPRRAAPPGPHASPNLHESVLRIVLIIANPNPMIVCVCNAIRESEVREAARNGASCPTSAYRCFGRKPRCGQCFSFAREIIAAERAA